VGRIAPFQRYYLCIDGTGAADSVEYGRLLQDKPFGWRNLLTEFLKPDPKAAKGDERLLDPNHPFLPICTFPASGFKDPIAVVCPNGRNAQGLDGFWQNYIGETPEEQANQGRHVFIPPASTATFETFGRHTAATKSSLFMRELILVPAIERGVDSAGKPFAQIKHGLLSGIFSSTEPDVHAELLLISSHGWLGGFMRGDNMVESRTAQPAEAQEAFSPLFVYFLAGLAAFERGFFFGPKWIILAQCSTLNSATWLSWVKLMARGLPPVRGILGYEEVSPGVTGSITIARNFFAGLKGGQSLLNAWKGANAGEKWAAIVHKEAVGDHLTNWDVFPALTEAKVSATEASYLAFGASLERGKDKFPKGKEVLDVPPPFTVKVETADDVIQRPFQEITEDTLDRVRSKLLPDVDVRMTITPPPNTKITSATVRWIHMRETHDKQPALGSIFRDFAPVPAGSLRLAISASDPRKPTAQILTAQPTAGPADSIVIACKTQTKDVLNRSGMERDHSFVWPLVKIVTDGGEFSFPFSTRGLGF
jgi:hypothetical protein